MFVLYGVNHMLTIAGSLKWTDQILVQVWKPLLLSGMDTGAEFLRNCLLLYIRQGKR